MYKVLLVDDEPWSLISAKNTFDWSKYNFNVVKETTNPYEALDIIYKEEIDVAFVDIRMPGLSGIDLIKTVRAKGIDTEFVIISGFAEFSYAKEAIKEGVFDYCLKPIKSSVTDELLEKLTSKLQKKSSLESSELYENIISCNYDYTLLFKDKPKEKDCSIFQIVEIFSSVDTMKLKSLEVPPPNRKLDLYLGRNRLVSIFNLSSGDKDLILKECNKTLDSCNLIIGISTLNDSIETLPRLIREAKVALNSKFMGVQGNIFVYTNPNPGQTNIILEKLVFSIDTYSLENSHKILCSIPSYFLEYHLNSEDLVYLFNQLTSHIMKKFGTTYTVTDLDFLSVEDVFQRFSNIESLCAYFYEILSSVINKKDSGSEDTSTINESFYKLLDFVQNNYARELYLKSLAETFHLNFTYCCDLFKKVTGVTFSQYVTGLRMRKASELLQNSDLSIDDICSEIGYNDYRYFTTVFKKIFNTTPHQYRKSVK